MTNHPFDLFWPVHVNGYRWAYARPAGSDRNTAYRNALVPTDQRVESSRNPLAENSALFYDVNACYELSGYSTFASIFGLLGISVPVVTEEADTAGTEEVLQGEWFDDWSAEVKDIIQVIALWEMQQGLKPRVDEKLRNSDLQDYFFWERDGQDNFVVRFDSYGSPKTENPCCPLPSIRTQAVVASGTVNQHLLEKWHYGNVTGPASAYIQQVIDRHLQELGVQLMPHVTLDAARALLLSLSRQAAYRRDLAATG